ncbi:hypothetical protein [Nocardia sp. NPDC004711]
MTVIPQYFATPDGSQVRNTAPLHFELTTDPDPARVSPSSGDPERADLVLVGSRRSGVGVECRKITIMVPVGTNSPDLTPDIASISPQISLENWSPRTDATAKTITFTTPSGSSVITRDEGVTIQLMGARINEVVGSAPLRIDMEWRETGFGDDEPWETGSVTFNVGKFPPSFRLDNFMAERLIIDNGDSVKLNWEVNGASSLKLLYDGGEFNVMGETTKTMDNVTRTTVFYLRGTVQVGNNTVERTLATTVTVRIPDLVVGNLMVQGQFLIQAEPMRAVVSPVLGADPNHPPELMLDDNLDTYYLSQHLPVPLMPVQVHFGRTLNVRTVDLYFGDGTGRYLPNGARLSLFDVVTLTWRDCGTFGSQPEYHYATDTNDARYTMLQINTIGISLYRLAIRGIVINPPPDRILRIDGRAAEFNIPVIANDGITEP